MGYKEVFLLMADDLWQKTGLINVTYPLTEPRLNYNI